MKLEIIITLDGNQIEVSAPLNMSAFHLIGILETAKKNFESALYVKSGINPGITVSQLTGKNILEPQKPKIIC